MFDPFIVGFGRQIENLLRRMFGVERRLAEVEQGLNKNWSQSPQSRNGGGNNPPLFAVTPSTSSWAGGAPPGGSPGSFTADVYRIAGGAYVLVASGATVYNGYPSSPGNSKVVSVSANADGSYSLLGESCE